MAYKVGNTFEEIFWNNLTDFSAELSVEATKLLSSSNNITINIDPDSIGDKDHFGNNYQEFVDSLDDDSGIRLFVLTVEYNLKVSDTYLAMNQMDLDINVEYIQGEIVFDSDPGGDPYYPKSLKLKNEEQLGKILINKLNSLIDAKMKIN